tara:strand:+ start:72670 stop:74445 length:1776 start_codon:yes stop_codon:yes gene_type:complete
MKSIKTLFLILLILLCPGIVFSQLHQDQKVSVFQAIDMMVEQGELSFESGLIQKLYGAFDTERLDPQFQLNHGSGLICLTPIIHEYINHKSKLSSATILEFENILNPFSTDASLLHQSDSGYFNIYYWVEGIDAVSTIDTNNSGVPDYIESISFAADSTYRHLVNTLGYSDFLKDQSYEIRVQSLTNYFGATIPTGPDNTYLVIDNNLERLPPNDHPDDLKGNIYSLIAHELKHASQFVANQFREGIDWLEMDAVHAEGVVFTNVNWYINYLINPEFPGEPLPDTIFGSPQNGPPNAYYHVTWMNYFSEQFGDHFWPSVWKTLTNSDLNFEEAIKTTLESRPAKLKSQNLLNHMWHMASGNFSHPEFGFKAASRYPTPNLRHTFTQFPEQLDTQINFLNPLAAHYYSVEPTDEPYNQAVLRFENTGVISGIGIGVMGIFKNGDIRIRTQYFSSPADASQVQTGWVLNELESLRFVVVNGSESESVAYGLTVESAPYELYTDNPDFNFELKQNYPNPFNATTNIEFDLFEESHIQVQIFNISGKLIQTVVNRELSPDFYSFNIDFSTLSSGQYFYRLQTNSFQETRKMTVIK